MSDLVIGFVALVATVSLFFLAKHLYQKYPNPLTLPILTSTMAIAFLLLILNIPHQTYMIGGQWLDHLLGPAVVALAFPLYKQWKLLKKYLLPVFIGVFAGSTLGICSGVLVAKWTGFDEVILYSIASKSVTTPVSMAITDTVGGAPPLAAIFVIIAGIGGSVIGPTIFSFFKISNGIAKGVGMGTASHAIGTARIMTDGELAGAVSSIAMTISAIIVALLTPLIIHILL